MYIYIYIYIENLILGSAYKYFWTLIGSGFRSVALISDSPQTLKIYSQITLRTDSKTDVN